MKSPLIIITIHGTFVNEEDDCGVQWWQKDSDFEKTINKAVGPIVFKPFHWDGLNKNSSRIFAANKLVEEIIDLEKNGKRYAIIAHSHGGNIAWYALWRAYIKFLNYKGLFKGNFLGLENLQFWMTVGTPFLRTSKDHPFDHHNPRLKKFVGQLEADHRMKQISTTFMIIMASIIMFLLPIFTLFYQVCIRFFSILKWFGFLAAISSPLIIFFSEDLMQLSFLKNFSDEYVVGIGQYGLIVWIIIASFEFLLNKLENKSKDEYSPNILKKWVGIRHKHDEALLGLEIIKNMSFPILGVESIVNPLRLLFIWIIVLGAIPAIVMLILSSIFPFLKMILIIIGLIVGILLFILSFPKLVSSIIDSMNNSLLNGIKARALGQDIYGEPIPDVQHTPALEKDEKLKICEMPENVMASLDIDTSENSIDHLSKIRSIAEHSILNQKQSTFIDNLQYELKDTHLIHTNYFSNSECQEWLVELIKKPLSKELLRNKVYNFIN